MDTYKITVSKALGEKCGRCRKVLEEVKLFPQKVCQRCGDILRDHYPGTLEFLYNNKLTFEQAYKQEKEK